MTNHMTHTDYEIKVREETHCKSLKVNAMSFAVRAVI